MRVRSSGSFDKILVGRTVLVVDDDPDIRDLLATALGLCGAAVLSAASARQALAFLDTVVPDALISDLAMPGEDGLWLVSEMRKLPHHRGGRVPAIAVTAHGRAYSQTVALRAGFQVYLTKPVEPEDLCSGVAQLLARG
jgi:CheY-like chemotaxis protein